MPLFNNRSGNLDSNLCNAKNRPAVFTYQTGLVNQSIQTKMSKNALYLMIFKLTRFYRTSSNMGNNIIWNYD